VAVKGGGDDSKGVSVRVVYSDKGRVFARNLGGCGKIKSLLGVHGGAGWPISPQLAGFGHENEWVTRDVRPHTYSLLLFPPRSHPGDGFSRLLREKPLLSSPRGFK